ncbi:adenosine deaminase [Candidatus Bipolaricaulota bacterium]
MAIDLRALPKAELHVHLDGSMRLKTIKALAATLPEETAFPKHFNFKKALTPPKRCSLPEYLKAFDVTVAVLQTAAALERAAYELCQDVSKENVLYLEVRFAPLLHLEAGLSPREVVQAVLRGLKQGEEKFGMHTGLILSAMRDRSLEHSMEVAQLTAQFSTKGVVAFDLAGPERQHPPQIHREAIAMAVESGVRITLHAGEGCCPEQVRAALEMGAERIGHGVYLHKDPATEKYVAEERIPLEICPTSNLQVSGIMDSYADHPLKRYFDLGIPITLNTDNRLMSNIDLTHEYQAVVGAFGFDAKQIRQISLNGIEAAFASDSVKDQLRAKLDAFFS